MILKYCTFMVLLPFILSQNDKSSLELIVCRIPENFQVQVSDRNKVNIYGNELLIKYKNIGIYLYPGTTTINVVLNGSFVEFQAYMIASNSVNNSTSKVEKILWSSNGLILGFGQLQKTNKGHYQVQQYHFFLPTNSSGSSNLFEAVEHEIRRLTQVCLEIEISKNVKIITEKNQRFEKINDFGSVIVLPSSDCVNTNAASSCTSSVTNSIKININNLIDLFIDAMIDMIKVYNLEKIKLPNINAVFITNLGVFDMKGQIQTFNGTFEGLTTIKRTADVILIQQGHKYTASCGFGISNAIVRFNKYQLKYDFINICGVILGTIENIALRVKISADYNTPQCTIKLEDIKVSEFDKLEVRFTGFGIMDIFGPKLINWFTRFFKNYLKGIIEQNLKIFLEKQISALDCEKYKKKIL
ncbi:uncharacterized protein LOC124427542 [Vespa crabro]|uniref:uncharacterized protein LOC124427542 n=1 Tax=Vespa crabro TaxID=7445 RepID=UPI001F00C8FE|nr:uncharacterized protein LOC124427542 [Vespa crabro]XP_046826513.1 uncharacterized protein LOC124427542 [Vespa crabro]